MTIIRLLEPDLCVECRFARIAEASTKDGPLQRMIHCARGDCDNWDTLASEDADRVELLDEAA